MPKAGKSSKKSIKIKGRPSLTEAEVIKQDIQKYFIDGYSAYFCHQDTGYNKDTIYKYYQEWTAELKKQSESQDFLTMQTEAKIKLISTLDKRLKVYNDQIEFLLSKRTDKFNPLLENAITRANHALSRLHLDKTNILITPMLEQNLKKMIADKWGVNIEEIAEEVKVIQKKEV